MQPKTSGPISEVNVDNQPKFYGTTSPYEDDDPPRQCCLLTSLRYILILMNTIIFAGGVAFIVVLSKNSSIIHFKWFDCSYCDRLSTFLYFVGAALIAGAIFGIIVFYSRYRCLSYTFSTLMILTCIMMLAAAIITTLLDRGVLDEELKKGWMKEKDSHRCEQQMEYNCSGWDSLCNSTVPYDIYPFNVSTGEGCPTCTADQQLNISKFTITCHKNLISDDVDKYVVYFSVSSYILFFVCLVSAVVSCSAAK
eukprot:Tbor_TRINITY_DN4878_c0_g1::TRINITY_DN4878_c0_g1_i2::g.1447::m.1447